MSFRLPVLLMAATQAVWLVLAIVPGQQDQVIWAQFSAQLAYVIALVHFHRAAGEYPGHSRMGLAFRLLSLTSFAAIVRHLLDNPWMRSVVPVLNHEPMYGVLHQLINTIVVMSLLFAILEMASALKGLGLGFRTRQRDVFGFAASGLVALSIAAWPEKLQSFAPAAWIEMINLFALLAAAGFSLLLTGLAGQMGGGSLVRCFQLLSIHTLWLAFLVTLNLVPPMYSIPGYQDMSSFLMQFCPWLFAIAAAARAHLSEIEQTQARQPRVFDQALIEKLLLDQH